MRSLAGHDIHYYSSQSFCWLWCVCVCFCRLMSQLADVNTQSGVGMFHFHDILHCSGCMFWLLVIFCFILFVGCIICDNLTVFVWPVCFVCSTSVPGSYCSSPASPTLSIRGKTDNALTSIGREHYNMMAVSVCPFVHPSVCRMPRSILRTQRPWKPKISRIEAHHVDKPWTYTVFRDHKVKGQGNQAA